MITSIRLGEPVPVDAMRSIERAIQLRHFKWDTQVGDTGVLFSQPLLMAQSTWDCLSTKTEKATQEIYDLEQTIAADRALQKRIGVPRALRKLLAPGASANNLRTLRFDFHPTSTGWLLSEVNTDVPGGWGEANALPALFRPFQKQGVSAACPLTAWGEAVAAEVTPGHAVLLYAPGYLEDQQVVLTLGRELARKGFTPHLVQSPAALHWQNGWASFPRKTDGPLPTDRALLPGRMACAIARAVRLARIVQAAERHPRFQSAEMCDFRKQTPVLELRCRKDGLHDVAGAFPRVPGTEGS